MHQAPSPRNLVLCCDGTSNQFAKDHTNVIKLCSALQKDEERQLVYYHPGIGTRSPIGTGTKVGGLAGRYAGLAFGYELQRDIADAYVFLMNHYREGDRVFIFGFSRGAYTARVLASLLYAHGLAMRGNDALVPYGVDMLWAISKLSDQDARRRYFDLAQQYKTTMAAMECKPHFLGVWDTVSSVGWVGSPVAIPWTHTNPDLGIVRHAVSIDETRAFFRTNLYQPAPGQDVKEVWFPGTHCDVGGGHPEAESGMSKYALKWMADEARAAGLLIDESRLTQILGDSPAYATPDPRAKLHSVYNLGWALCEFVPKRHWNAKLRRKGWRMNLFRRRPMPENACVHDVAWEIPGDYAKRRLRSDAIPLSQWSPPPPDPV
ncbi:DUF2235 domain-containing protein [Sphingomonas oligophenolica]|uniref:DUF2235 domain-containing protein n=2 Tax=Sphingomonas oligophenolica TaxID=301154 RepID=A0ABU9YC97_9SPHN